MITEQGTIAMASNSIAEEEEKEEEGEQHRDLQQNSNAVNTKETAEGRRLKESAEGEHPIVGSVGAITAVALIATGSVGHRRRRFVVMIVCIIVTLSAATRHSTVVDCAPLRYWCIHRSPGRARIRHRTKTSERGK